MATTTSLPTKASLTALKVADLKALCVKANLMTTGNKADLVSRLLSANSSSGNPTDDPSSIQSASLPPTNAVSDPTVQPAAPKTTVPAAPVKTSQSSDPPTAPKSSQNTDPAVVSTPTETSEETQMAIEAEIAKRAARAQRFGLLASDNKAGQEELKKLERAKKFGCAPETIAIDALDRALGERPGRQPRSSVPTPAPTAELSQSDLEWEERKRKRAEKFGMVTEDPAEAVNKKVRA